MAVKRGIWLIFVIFLIFSLVISAYTASARKVLGEDYLIGNVIDNEGEPVANTTIIVYSGTMATQCMLYDGCYCNAPRCGSEVETDENGQYSLNLSDLLFEEDYYCNEGAGPEINLTSSDRCAPLTTDTHYCASASEGCVNDSAEYMLAYTNDSMPLVWANLWNTDETRYEYRAVGLFEICSIENLRPEIQGTIPSQSGTEGTSWTYDLKPRMDTEINRYWVVSGVSSPLLDISINSNHVATFNPKREGTDTVLFELYSETQNISDSQEVSVSVSGTPEDISTVNISIAGGETVARRLFSGFNCGDGVCSMDENCLNCPDDCGSCPGCDPCVIVVDVCRAPAGEEIPPSGEMPRLRIPWGILVALTALGAGGLAAWLLSKETLL
ncbi:hypothetical protein JW707_02190, partial [Candidatus Woesearchaeota archaeon]|nr:hypothetical protein [Candidatus Woesearchaeota archaeon]